MFLDFSADRCLAGVHPSTCCCAQSSMVCLSLRSRWCLQGSWRTCFLPHFLQVGIVSSTQALCGSAQSLYNVAMYSHKLSREMNHNGKETFGSMRPSGHLTQARRRLGLIAAALPMTLARGTLAVVARPCHACPFCCIRRPSACFSSAADCTAIVAKVKISVKGVLQKL